MGIKRLVSHFGIMHIAQLDSEKTANVTKLFIGSNYVHNLLCFRINGDTPGFDASDSCSWELGEPLSAIKNRMIEDFPLVIKLLNEPDTFERSIPVFRYKDGQLETHYCENLGYPNTTHEGILMYDNAFFSDKESAIRDGKKDGTYLLLSLYERRVSIAKELEETISDIQKTRVHLEHAYSLAADDTELSMLIDALSEHDILLSFDEILEKRLVSYNNLSLSVSRKKGVFFYHDGDLRFPYCLYRSDESFRAGLMLLSHFDSTTPMKDRLNFLLQPRVIPTLGTLRLFDLLRAKYIDMDLIEKLSLSFRKDEKR